jgi:hypothetical protein
MVGAHGEGSLPHIAHYPVGKFAQYREAVLWAQASHGPEQIALSHETALLIFGLSDANSRKGAPYGSEASAPSPRELAARCKA